MNTVGCWSEDVGGEATTVGDLVARGSCAGVGGACSLCDGGEFPGVVGLVLFSAAGVETKASGSPHLCFDDVRAGAVG